MDTDNKTNSNPQEGNSEDLKRKEIQSRPLDNITDTRRSSSNYWKTKNAWWNKR